MRRAMITPPVVAPAALGELKEWLAISTSGDDAALTALLRTSLETCEAFTGAMPLEALCEELLPASTAWQALATRPVQAVTWVEGLPAEGARFAIPVADYAVDLSADGGAMFRLVRPSTFMASAGRVAVRFSAGLAASWEALPDGLRHGVLRLAAHHYRQRESDAVPLMPPVAVAALWRPWRRLRVA